MVKRKDFYNGLLKDLQWLSTICGGTHAPRAQTSMVYLKVTNVKYSLGFRRVHALYT